VAPFSLKRPKPPPRLVQALGGYLQNPVPAKRPKAKDPDISGSPLAWRFSGCDRGGPFSWDALDMARPSKKLWIGCTNLRK
jgi:hypothetical protein